MKVDNIAEVLQECNKQLSIDEEVDIVNRAVHGSLMMNGIDVGKAIWWGVYPSGGYSDKSIENEYKEDKLTYKSKVKIIQIGVGLGIIKRIPPSSREINHIVGYKPKAPEELQEELDKRIADEMWGNGNTIINGNPEMSTTIEETPKDMGEELKKYIADEVFKQLTSIKYRKWLMDLIALEISVDRCE